MHCPKISVIMPTYNRSAVISDAINSVLSQTYRNIEIIIVDDGSTDDTEAVLNPFISKYDCIITYSKADHAGVSHARNLAIDLATGDYLFFLDSDDCIHPLLFERMVNALAATGASMQNQERDYSGVI
ncbi:MAG: glycosyltransferase family 2 protein [Clostridia bacterium]|nr:glycosyltransferase family 2 protein [Clostridia bacterium]